MLYHATSFLQPFLRVPTLAPAKVLVMATLIGQLPVWIGATLATWAICWTLVSPEACQDSPACAKHLKTYPGDTTLFHVFSFQDLDTRVLTCKSMFEHVWTCWSPFCWPKQLCVWQRILPYRIHGCFARHGWTWSVRSHRNLLGLSTNTGIDPTPEEQVLVPQLQVLSTLTCV